MDSWVSRQPIAREDRLRPRRGISTPGHPPKGRFQTTSRRNKQPSCQLRRHGVQHSSSSSNGSSGSSSGRVITIALNSCLMAHPALIFHISNFTASPSSSPSLPSWISPWHRKTRSLLPSHALFHSHHLHIRKSRIDSPSQPPHRLDEGSGMCSVAEGQFAIPLQRGSLPHRSVWYSIRSRANKYTAQRIPIRVSSVKRNIVSVSLHHG
jgi:hypothetical protein